MPAKTWSSIFLSFFFGRRQPHRDFRSSGTVRKGPFAPVRAAVQQCIMAHPAPPPMVGPLPPPVVVPLAMPPPVVPAQIALGGPISRRFGRAHCRKGIAVACASARGANVAGFVECTGAQVILQQHDHS